MTEDYPLHEQVQDRVRAILALNQVPQDGRQETFNRARALINRMRWTSREAYWRAIAECRKWVMIP